MQSRVSFHEILPRFNAVVSYTQIVHVVVGLMKPADVKK